MLGAWHQRRHGLWPRRLNLFIALGFCIGWVLGGPGNDTRKVLALGTGQRNIAAALVIGSQSFNDPQVVVMVVVVAIVGLVTLMPLARMLAKTEQANGAYCSSTCSGGLHRWLYGSVGEYFSSCNVLSGNCAASGMPSFYAQTFNDP